MSYGISNTMISHCGEGLSNKFNCVNLGLVNYIISLKLLEPGLDNLESELYRIELRRVWCIEDRIDIKLLHSFHSRLGSMNSKVVHK